MLFNSIPYMLFLPAVLLVYYPLPNRLKPIWLLLCSYFFYMCWNARYLVLILTSTLVAWVCGLAIEKAENSVAEDAVRIRRKKAAVAFGLVLNLGILFFFTSDLEPLPACSHAFTLTEEGVYERSDY